MTLISIIITIYHQGERVGYNIGAQYQGHHHATETALQVGWQSFIHQGLQWCLWKLLIKFNYTQVYSDPTFQLELTPIRCNTSSQTISANTWTAGDC